ncbi:MAG: glycosyl hydrolases family 15-domain-containing protein [Piptocephalis tieghemiana]|nr:MAG: glycosyl hydrolases family 15-domain-containing protein [Piptocephalis tieghemiana]
MPPFSQEASPISGRHARLDYYYRTIHTIILKRQNPVTGLLPASTAVTNHGDYRDAWVRDNVYSILAVFGLALAYRQIDDDQGKAYELEHSCVKLMRGLLGAMMRQANKVEKFKETQSVWDALHAKYNTATGETVVGDADWGHLQIDATSLFLLTLAQMTAAGFRIIYSQDEVDFVQNLVFYCETAYRTPDFGLWERGNKMNHGEPELNSSSIGMVIAALEALNGLNLFGPRGGPTSVIHVLPDEVERNASVLASALPRESKSKEVDSALLSVIGYPAFAVSDPDLALRTQDEIIRKLGGRYGCKRFLRDGHQTVVEDHSRLHYEPHELRVFENIESEWPLFFTYLILNGIFTGDKELKQKYQEALDPLIIQSKDEETGDLVPLIPELYFVPHEHVEAEKANPHSQTRVRNENLPLVWANSLYFLGCLVDEGLVSVAELDPLGRRLPLASYIASTICLLAEDPTVQSFLSGVGIQTETVGQVGAVRVLRERALREVYALLGENGKLGLSGRPTRPVGTLGTCKLYRAGGRIHAFTPRFLDAEHYYLSSDNDYLVSLFEQEVAFVGAHWRGPGRPVMTIMLTRSMIDGIKPSLMRLVVSLREDRVCQGVRVRLSRLREVVPVANVESLDFITQRVGVAQGMASLVGTILSETQEASTWGSRRGRSQSRRTTRSGSKSRLASPVLRPEGASYRDDPESLALDSNSVVVLSKEMELKCATQALKEEEDGGSASTVLPTSAQQDGEEGIEGLSLTLGDPSQVGPAKALLLAPASPPLGLYDRLDLLNYLHSCLGPDEVLESREDDEEGQDLTIGEAIEEAYRKATRVRAWGAARQAAGLARKVVDGLSLSLSDLLVRQKHITLGVGERELAVDSPLQSRELARRIYERCIEDVREGPLVQEILTYLANVARGSPKLLSGIMRFRTHYVLIALREEVGRRQGCEDEEMALEALFQSSPSDLQSLVFAILSRPARRSSRSSTQNLEFGGEEEKGVSIKVGKQSVAEAVIGSGPQMVGRELAPGKRGLNVAVVDGIQGAVVMVDVFDTHGKAEESSRFESLIHSLRPGMILLLAIMDEASESLGQGARQALHDALGSQRALTLGYRDAWCFVGRKGHPGKELMQEGDKGGSINSTPHDSGQGSAEAVKEDLEKGRAMAMALLGPSEGRWIYQRRKDGALNRVPSHFYPRVWGVLARSHGIRVRHALLPRDPTTSEKTAEEFSFAFVVEVLLDVIRDPAERQIAVEALMAIADQEEGKCESIQGDLPDAGYGSSLSDGEETQEETDEEGTTEAKSKVKSIDGQIDLLEIIRHATILYWDDWVRVYGQDGSLMKGGQDKGSEERTTPATDEERLRTCGGDLSYKLHERLARRLFYDLSPYSAKIYLRRAVTSTLHV